MDLEREWVKIKGEKGEKERERCSKKKRGDRERGGEGRKGDRMRGEKREKEIEEGRERKIE
jgi:hypothetical protein